ncbi:tRNA-modifying protein YgfZ [Buchnera aphidicola]|nr:tRNA-modifying protein YgfZ [Buchnera aphidicola]
MNKFVQNNFVVEDLNEWSIIKVSDIEHKQYLQNHVTIDLFNLQYEKHILCANCNANGKVNGVLRLFHNQDNCFYIQRSSICDIQLFALKKYTIFSKIKIKKLDNYFLLGIIGKHAKEFLLSYFNNIPNCITSVVFHNNACILWLGSPIERFLLMIDKKQFLYLKKILLHNRILMVKNYWLYLDIIDGVPILEKPAFQKFFPKEINLDFLDGINLQKGCYCGQEIISKMYFKNINNKKLYCLVGTTNISMHYFSVLEIYDGYIWRKIGNVLFAMCIQDDIFLIQCILHCKYVQNNKFRLAVDQSSSFSIFRSYII